MLFAKVTDPEAGYAFDKRSVSYLNQDKYYQVGIVSMSQSSTSFTLVDNDGHYNSVNFTFYKKDGDDFVEHDIFKDPKYNRYLKR